MDRATVWEDERNAREYDAFARAFPFYSETSRDLVARAAIEPDATVLDLCCGTGVTTETVLAELGPRSRVFSIDASAAMLSVAREQVTDGRVEWIESRAEDVDNVVGTKVDAVVCNSAMWQTDLPQTWRALRAVMRVGARLAFNIGRQFLILPFTPDEVAPALPQLEDYMAAIAILDHDLAPRPRGGHLLHPDWIRAELVESGFGDVMMDVIERSSTNAEVRAWLRVPVFNVQVPGQTEAERMEILDAAYDKLVALGRVDETRSQRWAVFTATAS